VRSVDVLGVRIDDVTYPEALDLLLHALRSRQPLVVTTPNPEFIMAARRDLAFKQVLNRSGLNIPDGVGLVLAARMRGDRLRQHVQGTDLVLLLAEQSAGEGHRWFLLGGWGDVSTRAAHALSMQFPGLKVVCAAPGSPHAKDDALTRAMIQSAGQVDVLLVAYGAPRQEHWLDRNLASLGIPVGIGVGGVFNYLSGDVPRAPAWLRRLHGEWLHRLLVQPWRWRRQLALPRFALLALGEAARRRRHPPTAGPAAHRP
jgi:N-acetylglucosaminyldiphosphoundecaprenol N-acetyl-beta-D-mannosaminyltransferase